MACITSSVSQEIPIHSRYFPMLLSKIALASGLGKLFSAQIGCEISLTVWKPHRQASESSPVRSLLEVGVEVQCYCDASPLQRKGFNRPCLGHYFFMAQTDGFLIY